MSFFDKFLKSLGFASVETQEKNNLITADEITHSQNTNAKNLVVHSPKNNGELNAVINCLMQGEPVIVDLSSLKSSEMQRVLDYVRGSLFALNGSLNRLQGNLYLLAPEGFNLASLN